MYIHLCSFGSERSGEGQLRCPVSICIDFTDTVFVGDGDNSRVSVFTSEGVFLCHCANVKKGTNVSPPGLSVDNTGHLYVCDSNDGCVHVY